MALSASPADALRSADPDRYLSTLYAPQDRRAALVALYAFDAEITGIRGRIREPLAGEMRLQWWRDAIEASAQTGHPTADALIATIRDRKLPVSTFARYLDARIFDLYDDPMPSRTDLEGYCGDTESAMIQLAAMILAPEHASSHADASGHAGCARGIAGMLLSIPVHRARGQCLVPRDLLDAAGTSPESFVATDDPATRRAVEGMIALGFEHMAAFEAHASRMPAVLRPAFLPLAAARRHLASMRGPSTVLEGKAGAPAWRRQISMARAAALGWRGPKPR